MKVLATSDMHGNLDGLNLDGIDVAFLAGDIAPLKGRGPWHVYDQLKWMKTKFKDWCEQWPNTKIVFVPGNHDFFPIAKDKFRAQLAGHDLNIDLAENAQMLIDSFAVVNGLQVYGTPWVPIISHSWAFEADRDFLCQKFDLIPEGLDVLLTHAPPHISRDDYIDVSIQWGGSEAFGSCELAKYAFARSPRYLFCGHIHSGDHSETDLGDVQCYNVSRVDERYEIAYEPLILDIEPHK